MLKIRILFLLLSSIILFGCSANEELIIKFEKRYDASASAAEEFHNKLYAAYNKALFEVEEGQLKPIYNFEGRINSLSALNDKLYVATTMGLFTYDGSTTKKEKIPAVDEFPSATALAKDLNNNLLIGTEQFGGFKLNRMQLEPFTSIYPITSIVCTEDSSIWLGSNIGLHRFKNGVWKRYHEEGTIGLEVPDNMIEQLYPDQANNLWVFTSGSTTILDVNSKEEHIEVATFDFLGERDNSISKILQLKNGKYLAVGTKGIIMITELPKEHNEGDMKEVHENINPGTGTIKRRNDLLIPEFLKNEHDVSLYEDSKKVVWFFSKNGIWSVPESKISR